MGQLSLPNFALPEKIGSFTTGSPKVTYIPPPLNFKNLTYCVLAVEALDLDFFFIEGARVLGGLGGGTFGVGSVVSVVDSKFSMMVVAASAASLGSFLLKGY